MRVLLIQPDYLIDNFGFRLAAMPEPLALEILAATIPEHDVRILDTRVDPDVARAVQAFQPELVAVTALTTEYYAAVDILRAVKGVSRDVFTVVGGHHCTLRPDDFCIPEVDAITLGEGEYVFAQLVVAVAAGRDLSDVPNVWYRGPDGEFVRNDRHVPRGRAMDDMPLPRRELTDEYRNHYFWLFDCPDSVVATSRGCPFRCNFCSVHEFYGGLTRQMSADRVLEDIHRVNTGHITFVDDNFLMNHKREAEIADRIKAEGLNMTWSMEARTDSIAKHPELVEKWADIGLYAVLLGLEGASDDTLASVNKSNRVEVNDEAIRILKANGAIIWGAFIVDPNWTADDFRRLRDYVNEKEITHTQFTVLTPLVGTELYRQKYDELLTHDYRCYDTLHSVLPTRLPRVEFYKHFAELYKQTDLGPYYDLVRAGKLSIEDCRRGKEMLDAMSHWERYLPNDPVLGKDRSTDTSIPATLARGA